jgi:hypothetical protein
MLYIRLKVEVITSTQVQFCTENKIMEYKTEKPVHKLNSMKFEIRVTHPSKNGRRNKELQKGMQNKKKMKQSKK